MNAASPARRIRASLAAVGVIVTAVAVAGCSGATPANDGGTPTGTLEVLVSSADASDQAFEELNADFQAAYPDVTVNFSSIPNNNYAASRSSRLTASDVDIVVAAPVQVPDYVPGGAVGADAAAADAGLFVDLTGQDFLENFTPTVIDSLKYKDKDYTVPTGLSYYTGVYYNKQIFEDNGLSVPTTWDEFTEVANTLENAGVAPIGIGGKDGWPAGLGMLSLVQGMYPSAQDKQALAESIWSGSTNLAEGQQLQVLDRVQSLYDWAQPNFAGVDYTSVPSGFAAGDFAMTVDGTWNQLVIDSAVNGAFDYGYFPLPGGDDAADNAALGGKVELRMAIAANGPNQTAAMAYLDFFSQPENYSQFVGTAGFAPAQPNVQLSDFLTSLSDYTATFEPAWDTVWTVNPDAGAAATFPFNYTAIAPLGQADPEAAANEAESAWQAAAK